jgi:hypothetical protein
LPRHGRPLPSFLIFGVGIKGFNIDHCSSVSFIA